MFSVRFTHHRCYRCEKPSKSGCKSFYFHLSPLVCARNVRNLPHTVIIILTRSSNLRFLQQSATNRYSNDTVTRSSPQAPPPLPVDQSPVRVVDALLDARDSPGVGVVELVVQRLDGLVLLERGQLHVVAHLEEGGRELDEPARIDRRHLSILFFSRQKAI